MAGSPIIAILGLVAAALSLANEITGQWFLPFEAMTGKDLSERLRLGFGGAVNLGATIRSVNTCSKG